MAHPYLRFISKTKFHICNRLEPAVAFVKIKKAADRLVDSPFVSPQAQNACEV
jgi:hypothetical protein